MEQGDLIKYFIKHTDERFSEIERKIDGLISFKWKLIGAAGVLSFIISILFEVVMVRIR